MQYKVVAVGLDTDDLPALLNIGAHASVTGHVVEHGQAKGDVGIVNTHGMGTSQADPGDEAGFEGSQVVFVGFLSQDGREFD